MTKRSEETYTSKEAADYLEISMPTLYRWIKNPLCPLPKPLRAHPKSRPLYFNKKEIHDFKDSAWMGND